MCKYLKDKLNFKINTNLSLLCTCFNFKLSDWQSFGMILNVLDGEHYSKVDIDLYAYYQYLGKGQNSENFPFWIISISKYERNLTYPRNVEKRLNKI